MLRTNIKGLGKTGLDIFFRRIQALWPEAYPFADQRTLAATVKMGLPGSVDDLRKLIDAEWKELNPDDVDGVNEDGKKRNVFMRVLERAVGADLEGNADAVMEEASKL